MRDNYFKAIVTVALGMSLALWIVVNAFAGGGNLMASLAKYMPFVLGAVGLFLPRLSIYLLFVCGAFMGYLKKLLVLDGYYGFDTMYYVVGSPAILLLGACVSTAFGLFTMGTARKSDVWVMVSFVVVSLLMMVFLYFKTGAPQMAVMGGAYVNVVWVTYLNIRTMPQLRKLQNFLLVMLALSSLVGFHQWIFGLTDLDLEYLKMGYETSDGEYDPDNPRPFATYGSSGQYGWAMVFGVAVLFSMLYGELRERKRQLAEKCLLILFGTMLFLAVFSSMKKAPMVGLVILPLAVVCVRSRAVAIGSFVLMLSTVAFLNVQGEAVSKWIWEVSKDLTRIDRNLTLNTLNTRIRSFEEIGASGSIAWVGPGSKTAHSHTLITEVLLVVGYVPAFVMMVLGLVAFFWGQKALGRAVGGWRSSRGREVGILVGFFLAFLAGSLMGTGSYGAFPGSLIWWVVLAFAAVAVANPLRQRAAAPAGSPTVSTAMGRPVMGGIPRFARRSQT